MRCGTCLPRRRGCGAHASPCHEPLRERKKERKTYARCQACVKGALASKSHRGRAMSRCSPRRSWRARGRLAAVRAPRRLATRPTPALRGRPLPSCTPSFSPKQPLLPVEARLEAHCPLPMAPFSPSHPRRCLAILLSPLLFPQPRLHDEAGRVEHANERCAEGHGVGLDGELPGRRDGALHERRQRVLAHGLGHAQPAQALHACARGEREGGSRACKAGRRN
jgi:hypothetical protein